MERLQTGATELKAQVKSLTSRSKGSLGKGPQRTNNTTRNAGNNGNTTPKRSRSRKNIAPITNSKANVPEATLNKPPKQRNPKHSSRPNPNKPKPNFSHGNRNNGPRSRSKDALSGVERGAEHNPSALGPATIRLKPLKSL